LAFFSEAGDRVQHADALVGIAYAHRLMAKLDSARSAYLEALRLSTETKNLPGIGSGLVVGAAVESSANTWKPSA